MHFPTPARSAFLALAVWLTGILCIQAQDDNGSAPQAPANSPSSDNSVNSNPGTDGQNQAAPAADPSQGQSPDDASGPINTPPSGANGGATFQTFYDSLSSQGNWVQTDDYGYVWQPNVQDPNWAPYTDGNWVYTDDGWTWNSNEPFGWATYHYGRWVNLEGSGWAWVPGYTWAPAWVSWRYGDGYVGWAPLPPDSFAGIDYFGDGDDSDLGFHIGGDSDSFYGIGPSIYIFLPIGCVGYHDYHHWYHNRFDNFALINHTTNVTNINVARGGRGPGGRGFTRVTTGGPQVAQIDAASETPVIHAKLARSNTPGASHLAGNTLSVFAPHIQSQSAGTEFRPAQVTSNLGATAVNRGTDVTHPPAVNSRFAPAAATDAQVAAAQDAIGHSPSSAKVLTDAATLRPTLPGRITSMRSAGSPTDATASRTFNPTPGAVYNNSGNHTVFGGPVHMPSTTTGGGQAPAERTTRQVQSTPQRVFSPNPAPTYTPNYSPSGGNTPAETHTYTHVNPTPAATPSPAPAPHSAEQPGGGGGGYNRGGSGGGGQNYNNNAGSPNGGGSPGNGQRH
jgi:hypothetical protein